MKEYNLKIFKQKRLYIAISVISVGVPFCAVLIAYFESIFLKIVVPTLAVGSIAILAYYFTVGHLKVIFENEQLDFFWKPKPLFNFKKYSSIKIDDITAIIIQKDMDNTYLTRLETKDVKIELAGSKKSNALTYTRLLNLLQAKTAIKPKDNWDVLKERGWFKIFYIINLSVMVLTSVTVIVFVLIKGFNSGILVFIPLTFSTLLANHASMRSKLKK